MNKKPQRALWWVKRDMRIKDNDALCAAIQGAETVSAFFVIEPALLNAPETSIMHVHGWWQALRELQQSLRTIGGELYFPHGDVVDVLQRLHSECQFDALFSHEETGSAITFRRDRAVFNWCKAQDVVWHEVPQNGVIRGLQDRRRRQPIIRQRLRETSPSTTPDSVNKWEIPQWPTQLPDIHSLGLREDPFIEYDQLQTLTESAAEYDLHTFLSDRAVGYSGGISSPNTAFVSGSRLSTHLAWGTISLRTVFNRSDARIAELANRGDPSATQWRKSLRAFQSRLHWRDHFMQRLESEPSMEFQPLNPAHTNLSYDDSPETLQAWYDGQTGMPMIDACMRCLRATGFVNFRMRAMLVTTACFGLRQSWSSIIYPLARVFYDYEPGIHISQIQMQAGIMGINTLRVYSPHKQLLDHDPHAEFVKRWIPELRRFKPSSIADYQHRTLGQYPPVITDIHANSTMLKTQIYTIRRSDEGKKAKDEVLKKHGSRKPIRKKKKSSTPASPQLPLL